MEEKKKKAKFLSGKVSLWRLVIGLFFGLTFIAAVLIVKDEVLWQGGYYDDYLDEELAEYDDEYYEDEEASDCNVGGLLIRNHIATYAPEPDESDESWEPVTSSEDIVYFMEEAEADDSYLAHFIEVDAYGGYPVASEEIAIAVEKATKPVVAVIREGGVSGAYWAIAPADRIFASANSDVGSIGITMSYLDYSEMNEKEGIKYVELSSGKFKDTGDPDKALSAEELALFQRDIDIIHENFIQAVAKYRKLDVEKVRALADGSTMLGQMAKDNNLIDEVGGYSEAEEWLKEKIGVDPMICW